MSVTHCCDISCVYEWSRECLLFLALLSRYLPNLPACLTYLPTYLWMKVRNSKRGLIHTQPNLLPRWVVTGSIDVGSTCHIEVQVPVRLLGQVGKHSERQERKPAIDESLLAPTYS